MTTEEIVARYPSFRAAMDDAPGLLEQMVEGCPERFRAELDRLVTETARLFHQWYVLGNKIQEDKFFVM